MPPSREMGTIFGISERLRSSGWLVPAYTFPENRQDLAGLATRYAKRVASYRSEVIIATIALWLRDSQDTL